MKSHFYISQMLDKLAANGGEMCYEEGFVSVQPYCLRTCIPIPAVQTSDPGCKGVGDVRATTALYSEVKRGDSVSHWRTEPLMVHTQSVQDAVL